MKGDFCLSQVSVHETSTLIWLKRSPHPHVKGEGEESLASRGASGGHLLLLVVVRRATGCLVVQMNNLRWGEVREHP
jgi:hypothetical protein